MMRREEVMGQGHLQMNKNVLGALAELHHRILEDKNPKFDDYRAEFYRTLPYIVELRARSGENKPGEIETCFNALYGMLMLRSPEGNYCANKRGRDSDFAFCGYAGQGFPP